jgi:hypothetical protein
VGRKNQKSGMRMVSKPVLKTFAIGDAVIIAALLSLAFCSSVFLFNNDMQPRRVEILRDNKVLAVYPLNEDRTIEIQGASGPMSIRIEGGAARVTRATCRCRICTKSAPIKNPGASIICVPNHVTVLIPKKETDASVDAVSR